MYKVSIYTCVYDIKDKAKAELWNHVDYKIFYLFSKFIFGMGYTLMHSKIKLS